MRHGCPVHPYFARVAVDLHLDEVVTASYRPELRDDLLVGAVDALEIRGEGAEKRHRSKLVHEEGVEPSRLAAPEPKREMSVHERSREKHYEYLAARAGSNEHDERALAQGWPTAAPPAGPPPDPVEAALAEALSAAARAGQWEAVVALTAELAARRAR
jgi:hypothetical protein